MRKAILYYTCNTHPADIERACRAQLRRAAGGLEIGTVSREPINFGDWNIVIEGERGPLTMHHQILAGLERTVADCVFLCESDVLYHPDHFEFTPPFSDTFYYNANVWRVRYPDGHAVWTDGLQQVSGICAPFDILYQFYLRRASEIERGGFDRHYEPQPKTGCKATNWMAGYPNLDIRHDKTLTRSKWSPGEFRNKRYAEGWKETGHVVGWGQIEGRFLELLAEVTDDSA